MTRRTTSRKPNHIKHKPHTKHFAKVYWPYIPVMIFMLIGLPFLSQPRVALGKAKGNVLAYATDMTQGGLLGETNAQRAAYGVAGLSLNGTLSQAAQNKANDMVTRNYWSHNTPDGNPPWVFIDAVGYAYKKAGENLAYGFGTSSEAVTGWMNSPSHKANLLDGSYKQVGFGIANSSNYQNQGEMTIVVAMYADPYVAPPAEPTPNPTPASQPVLPVQTVQNTTTEPAPTEAPVASATPLPDASPAPSVKPTPAAVGFTTQSPTDSGTHSVSRIEAFTKGRAPWSYYTLLVSLIAALVLFAIKHAIAIKRFVIHGEALVINHPLFDVGMMAIVALAYYATRSVGFIS